MNWSFIAVCAMFAGLLALRFRAIRRSQPRYHVMRELDPGWHQVQAALKGRPDPEVDRLIERSQNGEGRS